ncbi:MAG TPA: methylated-DNA--[protein]-cysteine S-methyltransferase [Actinomycetota bacterium]|jgi:methylated-DNA-[protein]-cysteine S-methyltransferase
MKPTIRWTRELEEASRRAAESTVARADRTGLVDVGYGTVDTPIGRVLIAVTKVGLVRVAYPDEDLDLVLEELADDLSPRVLEDPRRTDGARRQLDAYFEGRVKRFRTALDWSLATGGFSRRVLEATAAIPFGSVSTYRDVATRAGSPRAARAAGNALHDNPLPIVVPCHRVVPSAGGIGQYGGDPWRKEFLLRLEGALDG